MLTMMTRDLDLTDTQKDKMKELIATHEKKFSATVAKLHEGKERPDREVMRAAFTKFREDFLKDLKPILTEEQRNKLDKAAERIPAPGPRPPAKPEEK